VLKLRGPALALGALAILAGALYLPFLASPPFYDDRVIFSGRGFADAAGSPLALTLRQPAYFSLAFVQVLWGSIEAHRLASLAVHVACAWALYGLLRELQRSLAAGGEPQARLPAFFGAALFVLHPAGVYGAGYLVQRSILLATLFALLSAMLFLRGLRRRSYADALSAAALFSLGVLSKEHAVLLPVLLAATAFVHHAERRFALRYAGVYLAGCAPAALFVVSIAKGLLGARYEPEAAEIAAGIEDAAPAGWRGSASAQLALFFRYLGVWLWPRTGAMSIDLKVDFLQLWSPAVAIPAALGFLAFAVAAILLLGRRGYAAMAGFGLLYFWVLYLVELTTVRLQEPFVLYRSYLWAPGLAIAVAVLLARVPARAAGAVACAAAALLAVQAQDRLRSFSSGLALWEDAAGKLPAEPIPGAWRTLYSLGREYLYAGYPDKALAVSDRCLLQYPEAYYCVIARGSIHLQLEQPESALPYLERAAALRPDDGTPRHHLGVAYQELGCRDAARAQYKISSALGFAGARFRLQSLDSPGKGLLPPSVLKKRGSFACPA
jgi:protein O-mannosyl-transferase